MSTSINIRQIMTEKVIVATLNNTFTQVMHFFTDTGIQHLPVTFDNQLVGIVSVNDMLKYISTQLPLSTNTSDLEKEFNLKQYMTINPVTLSPKDTVQHAVEILAEGKFQALPVVEEGVIVGIVTNKDIVRLQDHINKNL